MAYWITIWILRVFFKVFTRFRVSGRERVPNKGAFLLVSNHISHFDPPVFSAACPRMIHWMGSEILFRKPWMRAYFRAVNVIKVRQYEADQSALREAIRRARAGYSVGLFPEGGIRVGEASLLGSQAKLYEGAFMIAAMSRIPILPCVVIGSDRLYNPRSLLQRPTIWARFGEPILVEGNGRAEIHRLKEKTVEVIRGLVEELKAKETIRTEDWPQTPQQRNPRIPPPQVRHS